MKFLWLFILLIFGSVILGTMRAFNLNGFVPIVIVFTSLFIIANKIWKGKKDTKTKTKPDPTAEYEGAIPENIPTTSTSTFCDEDAVYYQIAEEFENGVEDKGLWTSLFADCNGDETKTKARYIKKRAERLIVAKRSGIEQKKREETRILNELHTPLHGHQERSVSNDTGYVSECPRCGMENRIQEISIGFIQKCGNCGNVEYFQEKKVDDTSWGNRVLCSDDSCIGVIGKDGRCKACGKMGEIKRPRNSRSK